MPRSVRHAVTRAIGLHHGRVESEPTPNYAYINAPFAERWAEIRKELIHFVWRASGTCEIRVSTSHLDTFGLHLSALIIVSDWIASNTSLYRPPDIGDLNGAEYVQLARQAAREAVTLVGFGVVEPVPAPIKWSAVFPFAPRDIQATVIAAVEDGLQPGLVIIEAAMGMGKTEAAWFLAEAWRVRTAHTGGAYIALPTQATSNQMYYRYREHLRKLRPGSIPRLVHGMAWLVDDMAVTPPPQEIDGVLNDGDKISEQELEAAAWLRNMRRALLAPEAVGTIDQVLLSALSVKFGALRLFGLGTKVLIVDEVHACDHYMRIRLERALGWCHALSIPVILLSATLPYDQKRSLIKAYLGEGETNLRNDSAYPLLTAVTRAGSISLHEPLPRRNEDRQLRLRMIAGQFNDPAHIARIAAEVVAAAVVQRCVAVVVNTVGSAQSLFTAIDAIAPPDVMRLLFHSRFPAARRNEIEKQVLATFGPGGARPERAIVVGTQVLEQSLDLDFDAMWSELAPVDLVLQRSGRVWRHREWPHEQPPVLTLMVPPADNLDFGSSEWVYTRRQLLRTYDVLAGREHIRIPSDVRPLVDAVHGSDHFPLGHVSDKDLRSAATLEEEQLRSEVGAAQQHLIGLPRTDEFAYPGTSNRFAVAEAEDLEAGHNLRATTRLGDESLAIFAITTTEQKALIPRAGARVFGEKVRALFETRAAVPKWWLKHLDLQTAPRVLGILLVDLTDPKSPITYDAKLGLQRKETDPSNR